MADATKLVHRAIDLSDAEDYAAALDLLTRAVTVDPSNPQAYFERGMVLLNLDRDADAVADFDRALAIEPDFPGARDWRARATESLGDFHRAAEDRLKGLRDHPDGPHQGMGVSPQRWSECATAFIESGNPSKAKELLDEFFREHASRVISYACYETAPMRLLAELLIQSGDFVRACEFAHKAYNSKHHCPTDVLIYALALEASGDLANARRLCAEAMKINNQMPGVNELNARLTE